MKKKYGQPRKKIEEFTKINLSEEKRYLNRKKRNGRLNEPENERKCSRCFKLLSFNEFGEYKSKGWLDINLSRRKYHCRNCDSLDQKKRQLMEPWRRLHVLSKRRAKENTLPFNLTSEYIKSIWPKDNKCPITKKEFLFGIKNRPRLATLDKILPNKGYVIGNVVVVSHMVNAFKSDITDIEVFKDIYDFYKSLRKVKI